MADTEARWYVIHTYSGYENKVASNIQLLVENRGIQDQIQEVRVPLETVTELKEVTEKDENNNKVRHKVPVQVQRKIFPGYVLVKMVYTDETWYLVRNIRGCTGFVGTYDNSEKGESKTLVPVPLTEEEIRHLGLEESSENVELPYEVGDSVKIVNGPFEGYIGIVTGIDLKKGTARVTVTMFNRETPAEVDFENIVPID